MRTPLTPLIFIVFGCIVAALIWNGWEGNSRGDVLPSAHVVLKESGFEPREIRLKRGGTITFSTDRTQRFWPASNLHPQHEIYPEFDPKRPLEPNEEWTFSFIRSGTFGYHDHLRAYFNGVIYVE